MKNQAKHLFAKTLLKTFFCPLEKNFISSRYIPHLASFMRLKSQISHSLFFILSKVLSKAEILPLNHKKISKKLGFFKFGVCLSLIQVGGFTVGRRLAPPSDTLALRARAPKTSTRLFNPTDLIYPQKSSLGTIHFCR